MSRAMRWIGVNGAALLWLTPGLVAAQAPAPVSTQPAMMPYVDPAFGFELKIPAAWQYDRSRFREFADSLGLLRGRSPTGREALEVIIFRSFSMKPFEDWVIEFGKALAEITRSERVDWEAIQLPPRAGAVLTFATHVGADVTRSHYLCVPFDPSTVWVLVYRGAAYTKADEARLRSEFDQIVATLRVLYDPEEAEKLGPALDRGKALIERLRQDAARVPLDDTTYYFEIRVADVPVGYFTRRAWRDEYVFSGSQAVHRVAKDGLRVQERSWRFASDGTVRYSLLDAFCTFDLSSEVIGSRQVLFPAPDVQPQTPLTKTDQVVREGDTLFSSFTTSVDRSLPDPGQPMSVGPVYIPLAWLRLLPGLLLSVPPEPHAFAFYNTETRSLLAHHISPLGPREYGGQPAGAYAFEVRDGFIEQPATLLTDARGNLLKVMSPEVVVERTTQPAVEQRFAQQRAETLKRFPGFAE